MKQGRKLQSRLPAPSFRGKAPRFQQREATDDDPSRAALRALVQLLARQAAKEVMEESDAPAVH